MPRRPRSSSRPRSQIRKENALRAPKASTSKLVHKKRPAPESASESDSDEGAIGNGDDAIEDSESDVDEESEVDVDASRVSVWEEDEWKSEDSESENFDDTQAKTEQELVNELSSMPFGALRKAQLRDTTNGSSDDTDSDDEDDASAEGPEESTSAPKKEWSLKARDDINKRSSKHAPTEVSSKRPVSRKRSVVELKQARPTDPRFLDVTGALDKNIYKKNYSFLSDLHTQELQELRQNLKRARKLLVNSPRHSLQEREEEVTRLELALKRAESTVNRDRQEKVDRDTISNIRQTEKEKRSQGKNAWYMKESAKREKLVQGRYDALAASGGQTAVKKAIEKKQKKIGQKEKRSRPTPNPAFKRRRLE